MPDNIYQLEMGRDGLLHFTHCALQFVTPEAALIEIATSLRESGLTYDVPYYRCVEINPVTDAHIRVVWTLDIKAILGVPD